MTPNRRIFLNIVATYGRSLYALVIGLFTARWLLQALGQVDYGLYGLVGGLTVFISFINDLFAIAVGRFYAVAIGRMSVAEDKVAALEECRKWYSTATLVHIVVPTLFVLLGYGIGERAIRCFLTIPRERIPDCIWVFRFVCLTCYLGMVSVPVSAMYRAKQYIAELTIYSFITTTASVIIVYYMVSHPGVWLMKYAFMACCLSVGPMVVIYCRGHVLFPECCFRWEYCLSRQRMNDFLYYVGWWAFGNLGNVLRGQGIQVLANKYFGPRVNTSMSIANSVNGHAITLSGSLVGAFQPAIVTAYGAGDLDQMRTQAFRACKFSLLLALMFIIPLALELKEVLTLWLVTPPQYVYGFCQIVFCITLVHFSTSGHLIAINARGQIAKYQIVLGIFLILSFPAAWVFCVCDFGVYFLQLSLLLTTILCALGRVFFARVLVGMSARYWIRRIVMPIMFLMMLCLAVGIIPRFFMPQSFMRVGITTVFCELLFIPVSFMSVLDCSEREYFLGIVKKFIKREGGR